METLSNNTDNRFHSIEKVLSDLRVKVEGQGTSLKYLENDVDKCVTKDAFYAVKWIAYGSATIVLTTVLGWILNLVLNK